MSGLWVVLGVVCAAGVAAAVALAYAVARRRGIDLWVGSYVRTAPRRRRAYRGAGGSGGAAARPVDVLLCLCDHWEPQHGHVPAAQASARVDAWVNRYPDLFGRFRDADGRPPRHSFFFPIDEYEPSHVDRIAGLCRGGFGEVEIHHHHDNDHSHALRQRLIDFRDRFRQRHGVLPVDKRTGEVRYGFIHGNWALDNSRPDGRWCGVNDELTVLRETGCYADFTMPSAPSRTQTRKINSIYYAVDDPQRPKSHDTGTDVGAASAPPAGALLMVQGPLMFNWTSRKAGVMPRIENGNLQGGQPPTMERLDLWMRAGVRVPTRPDWLFVKLYTHGAPEGNQAVVLDRPMVAFHEALAARAAGDANFRYHYVTARETYNLVKAAEAGWAGSVADARDYELVWS